MFTIVCLQSCSSIRKPYYGYTGVSKEQADANKALIVEYVSCTDSLMKNWLRVKITQLGIDAYDNKYSFLGDVTYDKMSNFFDDNWIPINDKKVVIGGVLREFGLNIGWIKSSQEKDWNLIIQPDTSFSHLIDLYKKDSPLNIRKVFLKPFTDNSWHTWGNDVCIEAEVTPHQDLLISDHEFKSLAYNELVRNSEFSASIQEDVEMTCITPFLHQRICVYGSYMRETTHNNRPEIHPAEIIWTLPLDIDIRDFHVRKHSVYIVQDNSNFFRNSSNVNSRFKANKQELNNLISKGWKPPGATPLNPAIRLALEYDTSARSPVMVRFIPRYFKHVQSVKNINNNPLDKSYCEYMFPKNDGGQSITIRYPSSFEDKINISVDNVGVSPKGKSRVFINLGFIIGSISHNLGKEPNAGFLVFDLIEENPDETAKINTMSD